MSTTAAPRRALVPFAITAERRLETPRWLPLLTTLGAVAVALIISGILILLIGGDQKAALERLALSQRRPALAQDAPASEHKAAWHICGAATKVRWRGSN